MWLDKQRIDHVLHKRLLDAPRSIKKHLDSIFDGEYKTYSVRTKYLLGVFLLSKSEYGRVHEFERKGYIPFPALYTTRDDQPAAFRFENSRNAYLKSNSIKNSIAFSLGCDSTLILENHSQSIVTKEIGEVSYRIGLGYLLTFGKEIDHYNVYEYLDELIAYSVKSWRRDESR